MTADEKFSQILLYFNLYEPSLFLLMMKLERKKVPDKDVSVCIGVQPGELELLYNEEFVDNCPDSDLMDSIKLELTRLLLQHPTLRVKEDRKLSYEASNATMADFYPNTKISSAIGKPPVHKDTFEEYFYWMWDNEQNGGGRGGGNSGGNGSGNGSGNGNSNGGNQPNTLKGHTSNSTGNSKNWNKNDVLAEQIKEFVRENENLLKSSSLLGKGDNLLDQILKANAKSEVSPQKLLRTFVKSIESEKMIDTRMKLNRRSELDSPGYKKDLEYDCLIGIDVSGSIDQKEIKRFVNIITATAKASKISTVSWDTEVYEKKPTNLTRYRKPKIKIARGGGGTDPECILAYAKKNKYKNLILLTDGCFDRIKSNKGMKICFVCTERASYEDNLQKLGKYILLKLKH